MPFLQGNSADRMHPLRFLHQQRAAHASFPFEMSQVDRLSQVGQVMNLHTPSSSGAAFGHFAISATQNQMMGYTETRASAAPTTTTCISPRGMESYSNTVVSAAIETLHNEAFKCHKQRRRRRRRLWASAVYKPYEPLFPSVAMIQHSALSNISKLILCI